MKVLTIKRMADMSLNTLLVPLLRGVLRGKSKCYEELLSIITDSTYDKPVSSSRTKIKELS